MLSIFIGIYSNFFHGKKYYHILGNSYFSLFFRMGKIKNYFYDKICSLKITRSQQFQFLLRSQYLHWFYLLPLWYSISVPVQSTVPTVMELALSITSKDDLKSWSYNDLAIFFSRQGHESISEVIIENNIDGKICYFSCKRIFVKFFLTVLDTELCLEM